MKSVTSKDGTSIAFDRLGEGPPVILVSGGSVDRMTHAPLAEALAPHFTVFNYDRRGRGPSGDTLPYAVEREVEDINAVIQAAGGSAYLYGSSSGAALALRAAADGLSITKLALWEPPFVFNGGERPSPAQQVQDYNRMLAEGRRGEMVEYFMAKVVGLPPEFVDQARSSPFWKLQEDLAPTLAYDATIMSDESLPTERAATVDIPTLVLSGGASFPGIREAAERLVTVLPNGRFRLLEGESHDFDPAVMGPELTEFFRA